MKSTSSLSHNHTYRHRDSPEVQPNRFSQVPTSFTEHQMADIIDVDNAEDVFITDMETMPSMYRTASIREVLEIHPSELKPDAP